MIATHQANLNRKHLSNSNIEGIGSPGSKMASKFEMSIKLNSSTNNIDISYQWITLSKKNSIINQSLIQLIVDQCFTPLNMDKQKLGIKLYGLTEYSMNGMTFRANPCYKNDMPWFDWVHIAWEIPKSQHNLLFMQDTYPDYVKVQDSSENNANTSTVAMLIPAQLICIIEYDSGEVFAIIHSCLQYRKKTSVLTYRWQMEYMNIKTSKNSNEQYMDMDDTLQLIPVYHKVAIDAIQKHCLMIPFETNSQFWMEVIEQDTWALAFSDV